MNNLDGLMICRNCLKDEYLIKALKFEKGTKNKCNHCKKIKNCTEYKGLALKLKNVIRQHYSLATFAEREYGFDHFGLEGDSLEAVIEDLIGSIANTEEIIKYIRYVDAWGVRDGDNAFFEHDAVYAIRKVYADDFHLKWNDLVNELKTSRRFFSDNARRLFNDIFDGVESLISRKFSFDSNGHIDKIIDEPVVQIIPKDTEIYRARKVDSYEEYIPILAKPVKELSPPPTNRAQQGRMNAKGVSIFYGAFDPETCKAELRSSIGSFLVLGTFKADKDLRILDFKRLENVFKEISFFQPDARYQLIRYQFLYNLHSLISSPVVSGHEDEYLITQVLAEYLVYVRNPNFDGIMFESTQYKGSNNIVLFPTAKRIELKVPSLCDDVDEVEDAVLKDFGLTFVEDSAKVYKTEKITYETSLVDKTFKWWKNL